MTPREFWAYVAGRRKAERWQARNDLTSAWLNAMWQRAKKLPSLESVTKGFDDDASGPKAPLSPAESRHRVRQAFAAWGFKPKGAP